MSILSKVFGRDRALKRDARRIYDSLMKQSRKAEFYGVGRVVDNYDGRIDVLTMHVSVILKALNAYGEQGERLRQALFDEMKDDFEIALREEGISDTGVKKRIKPMVSLFYARAKAYTLALLSKMPEAALETILSEFHTDASGEFLSNLSLYILQFSKEAGGQSLGALALMEFDYPNFHGKT